MNWTDFFTGLFCLLLSVFLIATGALAITGNVSETDDYRYTVKAEQVNDDEMPNDHIDYENLTESQQHVLFRAFKKSDHFLGGASVSVVVDEETEFFDGWHVIRVEGVPILVAVSGPQPSGVPRALEVGMGIFVLLFGVIGGLVALFWLDDAYHER